MRLAWTVVFLSWLGGDLTSAALPNQPRTYTSTSPSGQYVVISRDRILNENLLDMTMEARRRISEELGMPRDWRHLVRLIPYEASNEQLKRFPLLKAFLDDGALSFEIHFPTNTPNAREEFLRTLAYTFLYDALLQKKINFDDGEPLPSIPVWLAEGTLQQIVTNDPKRWRQIVHRAVELNKAPPLDKVMGWKSLANDALMRAWQQAFSYQLADFLFDKSRRKEFHDWIEEHGVAKQNAFATLRPMVKGEIDWRHVLSLAQEQRADLIFSFNDTASRFAATQSIRIPKTKGHKESVTTLAKLAELQDHPKLKAAVQEKMTELTNLELRAHFSWRPIIAWQRAGLNRLLGQDENAVSDYARAMGKAIREQRALNQMHEQIGDYLNWFLVAKVPIQDGSYFADYYRIRTELESFEPPQEDPLRSFQIQVRRR